LGKPKAFWGKPKALPYGKGILNSYHKNHFFCLFSEHFLKKSHKPLTDGRSFFTVFPCFFSLHIYVFPYPWRTLRISSQWLFFPCSLSLLVSFTLNNLRPCILLTKLDFWELLNSTLMKVVGGYIRVHSKNMWHFFSTFKPSILSTMKWSIHKVYFKALSCSLTNLLYQKGIGNSV
jgi:hypothetical protein